MSGKLIQTYQSKKRTEMIIKQSILKVTEKNQCQFNIISIIKPLAYVIQNFSMGFIFLKTLFFKQFLTEIKFLKILGVLDFCFPSNYFIYHQLIQTFTQNKDVFYTSKIILDKLIDDLNMEQLYLLVQKDQFFIKHIMLVSLKVHQQYAQQILIQMQANLNYEYQPTDDEFLFISKIKTYQIQIEGVISPFKYLETTKLQIGTKLASKIEMILEYMISDHRFFMISSGLLYGMSLKWLLLKQHKMICQQLEEFLNQFDTTEQETVLQKIEQMMNQISNM